MENGNITKGDIRLLAEASAIIEAHGGIVAIPFMGYCVIGVSVGPHTDTLCFSGQYAHVLDFALHHEYTVVACDKEAHLSPAGDVACIVSY